MGRYLLFRAGPSFGVFCACLKDSFCFLEDEKNVNIANSTKVSHYLYLDELVVVVVSEDIYESAKDVMEMFFKNDEDDRMALVAPGETEDIGKIVNIRDFQLFFDMPIISREEKQKLASFFPVPRINLVVISHTNDYPDVKPPEPKKLKISKNWDSLLKDVKDEPTNTTEDQCLFCCENKVKICILPCSHFHFCGGCFRKHLTEPKNKKTCPTCQGKIETIIKPLLP